MNNKNSDFASTADFILRSGAASSDAAAADTMTENNTQPGQVSITGFVEHVVFSN